MKKYFYVTPFLYLFLVSIFLATYIIDSKKTTTVVGNISITVTGKDKEDREQLRNFGIGIEPINISKAKINLPYTNIIFSRHLNQTSKQGNITLKSVSRDPSGEGILFAFEDDVYVSFQTKILNPEEIAIVIRSPKDYSAEIFLRPNFGTKISKKENELKINVATKKPILIRPSFHSSIERRNNVWVLKSDNDYTAFQFFEERDNELVTIPSLPILPPTTKADMERTQRVFLDNAYRGLVEDRFNDLLGSWEQAEGFYSFSEKSFVVAYTESFRRGNMSKYKLTLDKTATLNTNALTWKSARFFTRGPNLFDSFFSFVEDEQRKASEKISRRDINFLLSTDMWISLPFWENSTSRKTLLDFLKSYEVINISPECSAMILYQSQFSEWKEFLEYVDLNRTALINNIVTNVLAINSGYMMLDSNGNINSLYSIVAAKALSKSSKDNKIRLLGYRILNTVLSLADENGILPREFIFKDEELFSLGFIAPEEVYSFLVEEKRYTGFVSTNIEGVFSFSLFPISITQVNNEMDILIDTEEEETTQFSYLLPLARPKAILAFDLRWSGAPFPLDFTKGVFYDIQKKLLVIKILDRNMQEKIKLYF